MIKEFNIEDLFDGIPESEIPNNRPKEILPQELHTIIAGGTCVNYFTVLFPYDEYIKDIQVIYKQLNKLCLIKDPTYILKQEDRMIIQVNFKPEESILFANSLLDTEAQVKITYINSDTIILTDKFKMKVVDTLQEE